MMNGGTLNAFDLTKCPCESEASKRLTRTGKSRGLTPVITYSFRDYAREVKGYDSIDLMNLPLSYYTILWEEYEKVHFRRLFAST